MARSALKALGVILLGLWLGNSSWLWGQAGQTRLLAHRGVHQQFSREGLTGTTCTAAVMLPSGHEFLENTLPSMEAAFAAGAAVVELDIAETRDGEFAVFHDWTLECRTEASGNVRDRTMAELRGLDIGYGYTADGGKTYPFRGMGRGLVPDLGQVLDRFGGDSLLINFKTAEAAEGTVLAAYLDQRGQTVWAVYGAAQPVDAAIAAMSGLRGFSKDSVRACLGRYLAMGWTGVVPAACRATVLAVPIDIAPFLWGWPDLFTKRMRQAGSDVILMGPYFGGNGFSSGIDDATFAARVPLGFDGVIWTDRIEAVAPILGATPQPKADGS
jgi:glycerophosphoryl diester phosphodiesterase